MPMRDNESWAARRTTCRPSIVFSFDSDFNSNRRLLDQGPAAPVAELARTRTHSVFVGNVEIESCDATTP